MPLKYQAIPARYPIPSEERRTRETDVIADFLTKRGMNNYWYEIGMESFHVARGCVKVEKSPELWESQGPYLSSGWA